MATSLGWSGGGQAAPRTFWNASECALPMKAYPSMPTPISSTGGMLRTQREPDCLDRSRCERRVVFARQAADADRADAVSAVEGGDPAEEEGEERVEARPLDRVVLDLLGQ